MWLCVNMCVCHFSLCLCVWMCVCFRMRSPHWQMPKLGVMQTTWGWFCPLCRPVYTEGATAASLPISSPLLPPLHHLYSSFQRDGQKECVSVCAWAVSEERCYCGLGFAIHVVCASIQRLLREKYKKKKIKMTADIFHLIPQIFCAVYFDIVGFWFLKI